MLCIQGRTSVATWLEMSVKQEGWNEEKGFVGWEKYNAAVRCNEKAANGRDRSNCLWQIFIGL